MGNFNITNVNQIFQPGLKPAQISSRLGEYLSVNKSLDPNLDIYLREFGYQLTELGYADGKRITEIVESGNIVDQVSLLRKIIKKLPATRIQEILNYLNDRPINTLKFEPNWRARKRLKKIMRESSPAEVQVYSDKLLNYAKKLIRLNKIESAVFFINYTFDNADQNPDPEQVKQECVRILRFAIMLKPDFHLLHSALIRLAYVLDDSYSYQIIPFYEELADKYPNGVPVNSSLAKVYEMYGHDDNAILILKELIGKYSEPDFVIRLARLCMQNNRYKMAKYNVGEALIKHPDNKSLQKIKKELYERDNNYSGFLKSEMLRLQKSPVDVIKLYNEIKGKGLEDGLSIKHYLLVVLAYREIGSFGKAVGIYEKHFFGKLDNLLDVESLRFNHYIELLDFFHDQQEYDLEFDLGLFVINRVREGLVSKKRLYSLAAMSIQNHGFGKTSEKVKQYFVEKLSAQRFFMRLALSRNFESFDFKAKIDILVFLMESDFDAYDVKNLIFNVVGATEDTEELECFYDSCYDLLDDKTFLDALLMAHYVETDKNKAVEFYFSSIKPNLYMHLYSDLERFLRVPLILSQMGCLEEVTFIYRMIFKTQFASYIWDNALAHSRRGEHDIAIYIYKKMLWDNPEDVYAIYNLAKSYLSTSRPDLAIKVVLKGTKNNPQDTRTISVLLEAYFAEGMFDEMFKLAEFARGKFPDNLILLTSIARLYSFAGEHEKSNEYYSYLMEQDSNDQHIVNGYINMLYGWANDLFTSGDLSEARDKLAICEKQIEDSKGVLLDNGKIALISQNIDLLLEEIKEEIERAKHFDPRVETALETMWEYRRKGMLAQARNYLKQLMVLHKDNVKIMGHFGFLSLDMMNYNDAKKVFQEILEIQADNSYAIYGLATFHRKLRNYPTAIGLYEKLLVNAGRHPVSAVVWLADSQKMLALRMEKNGDLKEARRFYEASKGNYLKAIKEGAVAPSLESRIGKIGDRLENLNRRLLDLKNP